MNIFILYEDNDIIVIDKPPNVAVNRSNNEKGFTIQDWAEKKLNLSRSDGETIFNNFFNRGGIIHRLDKFTSGILLIAKNCKSFEFFQSQFAKRLVVKKYQTLVHDKVIPKEGIINVPVGRLPWNRRKFGVLPNGNPAKTSYSVISYYSNQKTIYSFLEVIPHSGRTHQIRIHLKHIGHPIVSDNLYAGRNFFISDKRFSPRLFLHACYIKIRKIMPPNEYYEITSPLYPDLAGVLKQLNPF
ncbi:hypothetical protein A2Y99_04960 [Candidatus Gottesmanbacteria bacterium RBG_13_37_7]|uniref:Pseudouridine synthase RsuA/RluA-like domain-containing protein n=1 Tax=Candidatus Gottesmanbacteria bacterium RBG_13_37_7 TaxID=1798369 RepID=A0A1F5YG99_9BACT|nr:MAG: hypothetical protein A2Y99_04960 [Candidatus Gottesmanbacteria bacterium RBG_13_37_7]